MATHITMFEAYATIKKAHAEKRLSAQVNAGMIGGCYLRHPVNQAPCAIGCLLADDDPVIEAHNNSEFGDIQWSGMLSFDSAGTRDWLGNLQYLHDEWQVGRTGEASFLETLEKGRPL